MSNDLNRPSSLTNRRQFVAMGAGVIAASSVGLHAQTRTPAPPAKPTGQVVVGLSQEPTVFNPLMPGIEVDEAIWMSVFDCLWFADPSGKLVPNLAAEIPTLANGGISEGGLAWKVKLRPGVVWHDGAPFTAEDVKFSLELINAPGFRARTRIGHQYVRDIVVKSPLEITWRMEKVYAPYTAMLAITQILPKHILGKAADPNTAPFNGSPVGTGPFRWGTRTPGDNITLLANTHYHGKGPYVERLILKYIPDNTALYAQFRTGQVDVIVAPGIPANFYAEAQKLPGRKVMLAPNSNIENIMINLKHPALSDKAVRQALFASINKKDILETMYYGVHRPSESFSPQESWAFDPTLPKQVYDPARANKILEDAGWKRGPRGVRVKNGVPLEFAISTTTGNSLREQVEQLIAQDWQQIGAGVKINNMPAAVLFGDFYVRSKFEALLVGATFRTGIDPDPASRFKSDAIPVLGGSGGNYMQWINPEVDKLLVEGQTTFDQEKRKSVYAKLQRVALEELPILPIFQYAAPEGYKEGLIGFEPNINARSNVWNPGSWYWAR